ncbi:MAG: hypothetical protein ABSH28_12160 [Acidobacteriota bacterium]|jgi:hypothetical protein
MKIGGIERIALEVAMACSLDGMSVEGSVRDAVIGVKITFISSQCQDLTISYPLPD